MGRKLELTYYVSSAPNLAEKHFEPQVSKFNQYFINVIWNSRILPLYYVQAAVGSKGRLYDLIWQPSPLSAFILCIEPKANKKVLVRTRRRKEMKNKNEKSWRFQFCLLLWIIHKRFFLYFFVINCYRSAC